MAGLSGAVLRIAFMAGMCAMTCGCLTRAVLQGPLSSLNNDFEAGQGPRYGRTVSLDESRRALVLTYCVNGTEAGCPRRIVYSVNLLTIPYEDLHVFDYCSMAEMASRENSWQELAGFFRSGANRKGRDPRGPNGSYHRAGTVEALWQWKGKEDPPPPPTPQGTPVKCGGYIWRPDSDGILRSGQGEAISDATGVRSVLSRGEAIMDAEGAIIPLHGRVYVIALPPAGKPERAFGYWLLTPVAVVGDIILSPVYLAVGVIYLADVFNR